MSGRQLRDDGITKVISNNPSWSVAFGKSARNWFKRLPPGKYFTGEDIRLAVIPIIGPPRHCNAWGASMRGVLNGWFDNGLIEQTGIRQAKDPKGHARNLLLYRKKV